MIIITALRFVNELITDAMALRAEVLARYPHLLED